MRVMAGLVPATHVARGRPPPKSALNVGAAGLSSRAPWMAGTSPAMTFAGARLDVLPQNKNRHSLSIFILRLFQSSAAIAAERESGHGCGHGTQAGAAPAQPLHQGAEARAHLRPAQPRLDLRQDRPRRRGERSPHPPDRPDALRRQELDDPADHAIIQLMRLDAAHELAARAVDSGDLKAIDSLLKVLERMMGWTAPRTASACQDGRCRNPI